MNEMRYLILLILPCVLFFSSARADGLTAVGCGAAQFCCVGGSIMMDSTQSTPWADIDRIYWDREGDDTFESGGSEATYATFSDD
jgi:hypothetical protein